MIPPLLADAAVEALRVVADHGPAEPWYTHDWLWVAIGSVVSAGVALATFRLASFTKTLAEKTAELSVETRQSVRAAENAIAAEDRRHQDSLQPHLAITLADIIDLDERKRHTGTQRMTVTNIGPGFASNMRFDIVDGSYDRRISYVPVGALGSNQSRDVLIGFDGDLLEQFIVVYEDAFGRRYESRMNPPYIVGAPYVVRRLADDEAGLMTVSEDHEGTIAVPSEGIPPAVSSDEARTDGL